MSTMDIQPMRQDRCPKGHPQYDQHGNSNVTSLSVQPSSQHPGGFYAEACTRCFFEWLAATFPTGVKR